MVRPHTKIAGCLITLAVLSYLTYVSLTETWVPILDGANLIFHEAGHWIFFWGPPLLVAFGGTLAQLLVPFICAVAYWYQRHLLGTMVALWWFGQNLVNVSVYVSDARARLLPLLGGDSAGHDWAFILSELGLLEHDVLIGKWVFFAGAFLMCGVLLELLSRIVAAREHRFH